MSIRMIDYYIKGLPMKIRQEIFRKIDDVNPIRVNELLKKSENYKSFRVKGYSDCDIIMALQDSARDFAAVNEVMVKNGRPPLFKKPSDTYESSKRYLELLKREDEETLVKYFGCTWDEYIPESSRI